MVETTDNQITSPFHLFKRYSLCVSILVPSLVFTSFLGLGFHVTFFTTTILILSTSFLVKFSKKTKRQFEGDDKVDQEEEVLQQPLPMNNSFSEAVQEADSDIVNELRVDEPLDWTSESDRSSDDSGSSSVNLEMNWRISGNMEENPEISYEYSTSEDDYDDEGLIEIAIPSNDSNFPTFLPESTILQQQDFVELLAKINEVTEEENLIEIDISMGSIKCPSFEIEA